MALVVESVGASIKSRGGPWLSVPTCSRRSALADMAVGFAFSVPRMRVRVREPLRASERADGRGLLGVDRGQRRQADHGAWPRGQTAGDGCPHASADF